MRSNRPGLCNAVTWTPVILASFRNFGMCQHDAAMYYIVRGGDMPACHVHDSILAKSRQTKWPMYTEAPGGQTCVRKPSSSMAFSDTGACDLLLSTVENPWFAKLAFG